MSDSDGESSISRPTTPVTALPITARPYRFTWDPSSRRPGPESVSGTTTDGQPDYFATNFGGFHLNASNLTLGSLPVEWSSSKHGFHAISTVLNHPHKRQAPPKAHSSLPSVPPADLPRVRRKDFDSYLHAITPEWDKFERGLQLAAQADEGPSTPRASIGSFSSLDHPHGKSLPALDAVPPIFFEPKFDFGDPRTFAAVTEQDSTSDPNHDPISLSHSLPLLEKFSHYADTIELHLTHEISVRSSSFFAALSNLHHLQAESSSCLSQVTKLRKLLVEVDEDVAKRGMDVVDMERKMQDLRQIEDGVHGVRDMVEMTGKARDLVSQGLWGPALGLVEELDGMWNSAETNGSLSVPSNHSHSNGSLSPIPASPEDDQEHHIPSLAERRASRLSVSLSSLNAFSALPSHLRSLTMEIASSLSSEFVAVLKEDLMSRISTGTEKSRSNESIKDRLNPLLEGLSRTKGFREAGLSWREVVLTEIRGLVGNPFPAFEIDEDVSNQPVNGSSNKLGLTNHLRTLSHSEFMTLIRGVYQSLLRAVEGLQLQATLVGEVLDSINRLSSQRAETSLQTELTEILSSATELSHAQAAKLVSLRSEQHSALPLPEFVEFFTHSWDFVVKGEVICRRMIVGLRGVVVGQAKLFLQSFHQSRLTQSAKLVEDEQWSPNEVSDSLQRTTDILVEGAVKDVPELKDFTVTSQNGTNPSAPTKSSASAKQLRIEDRSYFPVPATSEVLVLLLDYIKVIVNLDMLTTDTMSRVIEFLKAFNSRTCQVVLGAGAMRSAGLKNITAKHLALASQSLSIMIALIPYVRETFRRHLSLKQAVILVEFDKLKRDYQEHQNEIYAKLIAIMGDRLSFHIKSLHTVDWNVPKAGGGPNDYMEVLVKETVTLHKVLSRYLAPPIVEDIMTQVFAAINHRLSEEYTKIELPDDQAKARLLADAKYLRLKFSALKNVRAPSAMLETVVKENSVPRSPRPVTPVRSSTINSQIAPSTPSQAPTTPNPASNAATNQRLKGLLSARSSSFDKALPTPNSSPDQVTSAPRPNRSSSLLSASNGVNGNVNGNADAPSNEVVNPSTSGFKQIEVSEASLESEATIESEPLPQPGEVPPSEELSSTESVAAAAEPDSQPADTEPPLPPKPDAE
ncbi:vacuolar protein sorting-associated protein 54 [Mycena floridula]|nr:vacuolar protein sorting-associated protein 54 [Mycena floridula]